MNFAALLFIGLLFGAGFGYFVQRAGLCFAHGMGEIFIGKGKRIIRLFLVIFILTSIGFLVSGYINPALGLKTIGQIRGYGFYNLLAGMFFGAGIFWNGGCILGTLRQMGEGNMHFLVAFISFTPGMALVVYLLNPILEHGYAVQNILLPGLLGVAAPFVTGVLVAGSAIWLYFVMKKKA